MKKAFDFEGPVFSFLSKLADVIWLNCLFLVCSIPIFTIGASTTAMYYVTLKMARDEEGYVTKSFFKSFKQNFKQATAIWIIIMLVGAIIFMDYRVVSSPDFSEIVSSETLKNVVRVATMIVTVFASFELVYVFPLLAKFDNTVKNTISNAFLMSIRHLPYTIALVLIPAVPVVLMYFSAKAYILFFIMFALTALCSSMLLNKVFDNYIPKEQTEKKDEEETQ